MDDRNQMLTAPLSSEPTLVTLNLFQGMYILKRVQDDKCNTSANIGHRDTVYIESLRKKVWMKVLCCKSLTLNLKL